MSSALCMASISAKSGQARSAACDSSGTSGSAFFQSSANRCRVRSASHGVGRRPPGSPPACADVGRRRIEPERAGRPGRAMPVRSIAASVSSARRWFATDATVSCCTNRGAKVTGSINRTTSACCFLASATSALRSGSWHVPLIERLSASAERDRQRGRLLHRASFEIAARTIRSSRCSPRCQALGGLIDGEPAPGAIARIRRALR